MDFSQFIHLPAELSLLAVILILFVADLMRCPTEKSSTTARRLPLILLSIHSIGLLWLLCPITQKNLWGGHNFFTFGGMYHTTAMTTFVKLILNLGAIIIFLLAQSWIEKPNNKGKQGEFFLISLFTLLGMYFMISSGHFLLFFIGLELASVPMVALIAFDKHRYESAEAAAKFILLALFSAALLLYGLSCIYGCTGTLYFSDFSTAITAPSNLLLLGISFFIAGMGFKLSLVPFHLWTADTYEGAPTAITAYLSVLSKGAAAFTLFVILFHLSAHTTIYKAWNETLVWLILVSITLGNLFALRQKNLKRFMAFSSISQAGYLLLPVLGTTANGMTAMIYYLLVYTMANLGTFSIIYVFEQHTGKLNIDDYNGLYRTNPKLSFLLTLCLFSLAGIPPFAGFFSKFFGFMAAFEAGYRWVVLAALINTVVSLYYYLIIVKAMYINHSETPLPTIVSERSTRLALVLCLVGVLFLGLWGTIYTFINGLSFGF